MAAIQSGGGRAGDGAPGIQDPAVTRGLCPRCCEVDRDVPIIVCGCSGSAARIGVRCKAEMFEAVAQEAGVLVGVRCRPRAVDVFLLGAEAMLHLKAPAFKATILRADIADVLKVIMVRANADLDRVDVLCGSVEGPDDGRCFELGGRPFFVVVQGARGVGNDALALLIGLQEDRAEAVAPAVSIQVQGPFVVWVRARMGSVLRDWQRTRQAASGSGFQNPWHMSKTETLVIERGEYVVGVGERLLEHSEVLTEGRWSLHRRQAAEALRTITIGALQQPVLGSVMPLASRSAAVSRPAWRMAGERRRGGVEMSAASPVSKRAVSKLVASIGRGQKGNEAAVDLFACGESCGGCGVGGAARRRAWTYAGWVVPVLAKAHPAVKCRGVSTVIVILCGFAGTQRFLVGGGEAMGGRRGG
ncbi:hypothetical protein ACSSS7_007736 [Eimeria intestinalis]